jgi:tetratricopeptide (TPR) repeat protein
LHSLGKFNEAIILYDKALDLDKKCAIALAYKGLSLGELDEIQEALKYFKKALEIDLDYDLANLSKKMAQDLLKSKIKELKHSKTQ